MGIDWFWWENCANPFLKVLNMLTLMNCSKNEFYAFRTLVGKRNLKLFSPVGYYILSRNQNSSLATTACRWCLLKCIRSYNVFFFLNIRREEHLWTPSIRFIKWGLYLAAVLEYWWDISSKQSSKQSEVYRTGILWDRRFFYIRLFL